MGGGMGKGDAASKAGMSFAGADFVHGWKEDNRRFMTATYGLGIGCFFCSLFHEGWGVWTADYKASFDVK